MSDDREMPPPTPEFATIGSILMALEERLPGIAERATEICSDEYSRSAVVRLRAPKEAPAAREAIAGATTWLERATVLIDARRGWAKRQKLER